MRSWIVVLSLSCWCVAGPLPAAAQEGHPLKGSWLGSWEGNTVHSPDIVVVLNWDGKAITGTINPGVDNIAIKNATLNPDGWVVHFEAEGKDSGGRLVTYVVDGKIENLHVPGRALTGKWKSQKESGVFKIVRQ
jgi:hypothetical protein